MFASLSVTLPEDLADECRTLHTFDAAKMPGLSTTYLLPAIVLNPAFILHLINTFVSHYATPPSTISHSPHPVFERLGPLPGSTPYLDMHANDQMCWGYTAIMVVVQVFAFGKVSDNRIARRNARAARQERERLRQEEVNKTIEKVSTPKANGHIVGIDGAADLPLEKANGSGLTINGNANKSTDDLYSEGSTTETSEEEMMI